MATRIRCHYDILGVERTADDTDLKKAYRKLALKYHPDKNPDNIEEATAQFKLVQSAHEVLIDPQERAWYDRHREAILRGGMGGGDKYDDDSLDVFKFFNTSCYKGFGDDDEGFYAVYRNVVDLLAEEDYVFMPERSKYDDFPSFGDSKSDYDEVVGPFYAFWSSFITNKSYVWVEKYDTRDAPERRTRKAMEAENKKLRDVARKERNEEIRELIAYMKKRDKRVQAYKKFIEQRNIEIEKKAKEKRHEQIRENQKQMESYKEADWSSMSERDLDQLEAQLDHHHGPQGEDPEAPEASPEEGVETEEETYDDLYCVACTKAFKNEKAFSNHENSKKHKQMVEILIEEMKQDEGEEQNSEDDSQSDYQDIEVEDQPKRETDIQEEKLKEMIGDPDIFDEQGLDSLGSDDEEEDINISSSRISKKKKKTKRQNNAFATEPEMLSEQIKEVSLNESVTLPNKPKSKKARRKEKELAEKELAEKAEKLLKPEPIVEHQTEPEKEATESESTESSGARLTGDQTDNSTASLEGTEHASDAQKDLPKAAENGCEDRLAPPAEDGEVIVTGGPDAPKTKNKKVKNSDKCRVCGHGFPSRSKLFDHIKVTGHALLVDEGEEEVAMDKGTKKARRKAKR